MKCSIEFEYPVGNNLGSKPNENYLKNREIKQFVPPQYIKNSREIEKFPGNKREMNFPGNSRETALL